MSYTFHWSITNITKSRTHPVAKRMKNVCYGEKKILWIGQDFGPREKNNRKNEHIRNGQDKPTIVIFISCKLSDTHIETVPKCD